jgi:hypothetical protein
MAAVRRPCMETSPPSFCRNKLKEKKLLIFQIFSYTIFVMKRFYFLLFILFLNPLLLTARAENVSAEIETAESGIAQKNILIGIGLAVIVIIAMLLLINLAARFFAKLREKIQTKGGGFFKPIVINKYTLLETNQIIGVALFLQRLAKYLVFALIVYISMTVIFGLFEQTREFAFQLIGYIINPLKNTAISITKYIPNLFTIIVTVMMWLILFLL